jgi:hypothetical protein
LVSEADDAPGLPAWTAAARDALLARATMAASAEADQIEQDARERNEGVIAVRQSTLDRTFRSRIVKREAQLAAALDERIRRLRAGEIRNLREELQRRLEALEATRSVGVSFAPIAIGRLIVRNQADDVPPRPEHEEPTASGLGVLHDTEPPEVRFQEPGRSWEPTSRTRDDA